MSVCAIDYETYLISAEAPIPKEVCISYYKDNGDSGLIVGHEDIEKFLLSIFNSDVTILAHNMKFELLVTTHNFPKLIPYITKKLKAGELVCTKVYEQLLDNIRKKRIMRYSLADLVKNYFKVDISEDKKNPDAWRLRYNELDGIPLSEWPQEAIDYAIDDSKWTYEIYKNQSQVNIDYTNSVSAEYYLSLMGYFGITVDMSRVETLEKEIVDKLKPNYDFLIAKGLVKFNEKTKKYQKSNKKFHEHLQALDIQLDYTAKKSISTTGESLNRYYDLSKDETLQKYLEIGKYEKVLSAFVSRLKTAPQADNLIRTEYNGVVSSGRTSSRTSSLFPSVNIQQMPREVPDVTWDIRNCYVPRPGYKICSIDYNGLELSAAASQLHKSVGLSNMRDTINSGDKPTDMHSILAAKLKKTTYEDFVANKKKEGYKEFRQLAKPINLGFPGGIGYDTMRTLLIRDGINPKLTTLETFNWEDKANAYMLKLRNDGYPVRVQRTGFREFKLVMDELVSLKQELFGLYPDLEFFLKEGHKKFLTGEHKNVKNEYGEWEKEEMYSFSIPGFQRDYCTYTELCNGFLMQSPSAIGAKNAMNHIIEKYYWSDAVNPLAFIHDEVVFEVKDDEYTEMYIRDVSTILIDEMQAALGDIRIAVEADLMDYWKKAGGVWDKVYWKNPGDNKLHSD